MTKKAAKPRPAGFPLSESQRIAAWAYLAFQFLALPTILTALGGLVGGFSDAVVNILYYLTNALCWYWIFRRPWQASLVQAGQHIGKLLLVCLSGFCLLLGANQLTASLCNLLIPDFVNANNAAISAMVRSHPLGMALGTVVLVPIAEESIFRGLLFADSLGQNRRFSYALSVLGFCAVHVVGYVGAVAPLELVLCFVQYIPAGLILAASYETTGSLFAPALIHGAMNLSSVLALP